MARTVITGAAGLVARELRSQLERKDDVIALSHSELDIVDEAAVRRVFRVLRPAVVFNCAVIGVDECESRPDLARAVNVAGPSNIAAAAASIGATVVHFSTNYVFDGARGPAIEAPAASRPGRQQPAAASDFYTIGDEPRPVNVYGKTKAEGERAVIERCDRAFIIRTSWVFGHGKESFLATAAQRLRNGERVKAIRDIWASTTYVVDLVHRLQEILSVGGPATYHIVNSGTCTYEEFAREAARLVGSAESFIEPVSESTLMRAPRPRYTPMRCLESERLGLLPMRHWTAALADYVSKGRAQAIPPSL